VSEKQQQKEGSNMALKKLPYPSVLTLEALAMKIQRAREENNETEMYECISSYDAFVTRCEDEGFNVEGWR
jgi:hypothetical protein